MSIERVVEQVGNFLYEYYVDENKNKQGELKKFKDKVLCEKLNYRDDMLDGECIYYEGETLIAKKNYKRNRLDGKIVEYYPNGNIKTESFYVEGNQEGESKNFSQEGVLLSVTNYKKGKLNGEKRKYFPSGELEMIGYYENNNMVGTWKWFDTLGNVIRESKKD